MKTKTLIIALIIIGLGIGGFFVYKYIFAPDGKKIEEKLKEEKEVPFAEKEKKKPGLEWFQAGNTESITEFQLKRSPELEDNRMGDMVTLRTEIHTEDPDYFANRIGDAGLKWMRVSIDVFDWNAVEEDGLYSEYYVHPEQDEAITALADNGIGIIYSLVYWDEELGTKQEEGYSRFKTEEEIQRYLDYVRFIVNHFEGKIGYYAILNEPNIGEGYEYQQYVEVGDYINLVEHTVTVIREEDPNAKIVIGEVTPFTEKNAYEYFLTILQSDVMDIVDGICWHAGAGTSPEYMAEYYYNYSNLVQRIKDTGSSYGFDGEYLATEMHWRTSEALHPSEYDEYSETSGAKYLARWIVMHRSMVSYAGSAECLECEPKASVIRGLSNVMAGAEPIELGIEIESDAIDIRSYSFSLSSGDKLVALWTDGVAVDDDPGVKANLTFSGFSSKEIIGIDILNNYIQPLMIEGDSIKDLIVRDYPLILHIKK